MRPALIEGTKGANFANRSHPSIPMIRFQGGITGHRPCPPISHYHLPPIVCGEEAHASIAGELPPRRRVGNDICHHQHGLVGHGERNNRCKPKVVRDTH